MLALGFGFFEDWNLYHKVTFEPKTRQIRVNPGVTTLDIRIDVYSAWKEWYQISKNNGAAPPAIRSTGGDPTVNNLRSGDIYFLINDWQLIINFNDVRVTGVLFSDDFDTPFFDETGKELFAPFVSNLVTTVEVPSDIDLGNIDFGNANIVVNAPTAVEIREEIDANSTQLANISADTTAIITDLSVIDSNLTSLTTTINSVNSNLITLSNDFSNANSVIANIETTVSNVDSNLTFVSNNVNNVDSNVAIIDDKIDAMQLDVTDIKNDVANLTVVGGLTPQQANMLLEMYELLGLDPTKPLVVTNTSRTAGNIDQTIATTPTSTTVTRNP